MKEVSYAQGGERESPMFKLMGGASAMFKIIAGPRGVSLAPGAVRG